MEKLEYSGLPIFFDEESRRISFTNGLNCKDKGKKFIKQMRGLFYREDNFNENSLCYETYRDIAYDRDRDHFKKFDFRYDITVVRSGTVNGEFLKTSGHYHGYIPGKTYTYPEIYEVLMGNAVYILQKVKNFDRSEEEPKIDEVKAVFVEAGEAIIIPPFYGHCSINVGHEPLIFSNIAVVSCPLFYEPIREKKGLASYVLENDNSINFLRNPNYDNSPEIKSIKPNENPKLGINFRNSVYQEFIREPEKFRFLLDPQPYLDELRSMLV